MPSSAARRAHDRRPRRRATLAPEVQLCGDAHPSNFGGSAAPDRELVFDIDDFDETARGPWEWAVKRLRRVSRSPAASWGWRRPCGAMPAKPEPTDQIAKA